MNNFFQQYLNYFCALVLARILPICIVLLFGFMAYRNVQQLAHRSLPLVRRELDKQLTVMVLVQGVVTFFTIVPYVVVYFVSMIPILAHNPVIVAQLQFVSSTTSTIYYIYFAVRITK